MNDKEKNPVIYIIGLLVLLACLLFAYGVFEACRITVRNLGADEMPEFLSTTAIAIAGVLSTNLGAVIGVTIQKPSGKNLSWNPFTFFSNPNITTLQIFASYFYIAALLAALIVWGTKEFSEAATVDKDGKLVAGVPIVVPLIPVFAKSLVGVLVGALTVALGVNSSTQTVSQSPSGSQTT